MATGVSSKRERGRNLRELALASKKAFELLPPKDRHKVYRTIPAFIFLSLLDLLGIILLGTVATLTFNEISNDAKPARLEVILQSMMPEDFSRQNLILILAGAAVFFLAAKTILQAIFAFRFAKFQARLETDVASNLYSKILDSDVNSINLNKYTDYQYTLMVGVNRLINGIIGSTVFFVSDVFTTVLMSLFAIYASPFSALIAFLVFSVAYFLFNGPINSRAKSFGKIQYESHLNLGEDLLESFRGIKEIKTYGISTVYKNRFVASKQSSSLVNQNILWLNGLIRYLLELSILVAGAFISIALIMSSDLKHAVTVTVVFLVIGFRLIPNIQRSQNSINSLRISIEATKPFFLFLKQFREPLKKSKENVQEQSHTLKSINAKDLSFSFNNKDIVIDHVTFDFLARKTLVIIGESGSGKTTLIDLIAGLLQPSKGELKFISQETEDKSSPDNFTKSYITQNCALFNGSLTQNISLKEEVSDEEQRLINQIISDLNLEDLNTSLQAGSRSVRADYTNISGGERQRISIARAKFNDSEIVILDEPTSALDSDNEKRVIDYVREISELKTVILVTHNLELLKLAHYVLNLKKGNILFYGAAADYRKRMTLDAK